MPALAGRRLCWLDVLGIRLDSKKAEGLKFAVDLITPDNGEKVAAELGNATLTNIKVVLAPNPDLTITINRADLEMVLRGKVTLDAQIAAGKARLEGDPKVHDQLKSMLLQFTPDFEMLPETKPTKATPPPTKDPFEQAEPGHSAGGYSAVGGSPSTKAQRRLVEPPRRASAATAEDAIGYDEHREQVET